MQNEFDRAGRLWGAVEGEAERAAYPDWENGRARRAGALLDETRPEFAAAGEQGRRLDLWVAAAIALGEDDQTVP